MRAAAVSLVKKLSPSHRRLLLTLLFLLLLLRRQSRSCAELTECCRTANIVFALLIYCIENENKQHYGEKMFIIFGGELFITLTKRRELMKF